MSRKAQPTFQLDGKSEPANQSEVPGAWFGKEWDREGRSIGRWTGSRRLIKQTRDKSRSHQTWTRRRDRRRKAKVVEEGEPLFDHRLAGRGNDGQRVELRPSQALAGARIDLARKPGPNLTQLRPCPVWAPRTVGAEPRPRQMDRACLLTPIFIMGSNMAECHPVAFRFVMQAKLKPGPKSCTPIPRFTRTSAMADTYAPLRAGSDIVFLGGLIRYVLEEEKYFKEYVVSLYQRLDDPDHRRVQATPRIWPASFQASTRIARKYDPAKSWRYDVRAFGGSGQPARSRSRTIPPVLQRSGRGSLPSPPIGPIRRLRRPASACSRSLKPPLRPLHP